MKVHFVRKSELITTNWSGGTTTQLYIFPENSDYHNRDFLFRISTANVDIDESTFTLLPGISRQLMILEGSLRIEHAGRYTKTLHRFDTDCFEGDWETKGYGKVKDFNLMTTGKANGSLSASFLKKGDSMNLQQNNPHQSFGIYPIRGRVFLEFNGKSMTINEQDFIFCFFEKKITEIKIKAKSDTELVIANVYFLADDQLLFS